MLVPPSAGVELLALSSGAAGDSDWDNVLDDAVCDCVVGELCVLDGWGVWDCGCDDALNDTVCDGVMVELLSLDDWVDGTVCGPVVVVDSETDDGSVTTDPARRAEMVASRD